MATVILFVIFGLNVLSQLSSHVSATSANESLKALCRNKPSELRKLSQVIAIIDQLESSRSDLERFGCPRHVLEAITDLKPIVLDGIQDVCSNEKVEQIRNYYLQYIQTADGNGAPIPISLKNFFLAFGFKVSGLCKKNMINSLLYEAQGFLSDKDFAAIEAWTGENSFLASMFKGPNDYDDLLLASEVNKLFADDKEGDESSQLFLQTATSSLIRKIQVTCDKRFKPIYSRLILPLVTLSNIGFNYQGEDLKIELQEMSSNKEIHKWYKIVYICDALSKIVLVDESAEGSEVMGKNTVRIMTEEEVKALPASATAIQKINYDLEPVVYLPEGIPIGDEIIDDSDYSLIKLVNNFKNHKTEMDRIRSKLMRKVAILVRESIMQGRLNIIGSMFRRDDSSNGDTKANVIKMIDDYVQQISSPDAPVAGIGDLAKRHYQNAVYLGPKGIGNKVVGRTPGKRNYGMMFWRVVAMILFITGVCLLASG